MLFGLCNNPNNNNEYAQSGDTPNLSFKPHKQCRQTVNEDN